MREITGHKVRGLNEALRITARDEPGADGGNHVYHIGFATGERTAAWTIIEFQNGSLKESNVNGVSSEALIAVVMDRLEGFQRGEFACRETELALTKLQEAMHWLHHRTRDRVARGVEGTSAI
jgi:hypothetical protein